ncbi:MAG TPA: hypothetical protein VK327_00060, partial [Candidatus Paceibacterota bacterium]|nr:hypothetical protein [Candidatus Paceibacterota bacterium]
MKTSSRWFSQLTSFLILFVCLAGPCLCRAGFVTGWGNSISGEIPGTNASGNFRAVSAASQHTLGVRSDGTLEVWGHAPNYVTTIASTTVLNLIAVDAGEYWDTLLKADGTLLVVGANSVETRTNIAAVSSGVFHWLAVKSDGTVIGGTIGGGFGDSRATNSPSGLGGVVAVAAGHEFSLALKANGRVVGWGSNIYGESTVPAGLSNVVAIAAGFRHSLALKNDGTVVAWGGNDFGQCDVPPGLSNVTAITAGDWHSLALKSDGTVMAWGKNWYGDLDVPGGLSRVTAIAAGEWHSVALTLQGPIDIDQNPASQSVVVGSNAVFSVAATGLEPLNYQWFFGTNALVDGVGVSGASSTTLLLNGVTDAGEGLYHVVISNAFGTATSA